MADDGRVHDVSGLTVGELERARRELEASLALARPGSITSVPIMAQIRAIDAELARHRPRIKLCSCGFGTDDSEWFACHLAEHPGHYDRSRAVLPGFPSFAEPLAGRGPVGRAGGHSFRC
jgi:hypothetical protein